MEPLVDNARRQYDELCNLVKESSTRLDLKNRLANVERPFKDLQKKLGIKLSVFTVITTELFCSNCREGLWRHQDFM